MFRPLVLVFVGCLLVLTSALPPKAGKLTLDYSFDQFKKDFHKKYASLEEEKERKEIFELRKKRAIEHNAKGLSWTEGVNHMSDWTTAEFRKLNGVDWGRTVPRSLGGEHKLTGKVPPQSQDWRTAGVVSDVKDQGQCGSCWTFGSTATIESHLALKTGLLHTLSTQNVLDCCPNPNQCGGTGGCEGGTAQLAYNAMIESGQTSEWQYPYLSYWGQDFPVCRFNASMSKIADITGWINIKANDYNGILDAVGNVGPLAINVDASAWGAYEGGVFDGCDQQNPVIDHVVQLVGYGVDNGVAYWTVRNSWSPSWGENGYIRLKRNSGSAIRCAWDTQPSQGTACTKNGTVTQQWVCGTCGVLMDASYPLIGNSKK